MTLQFYYLGIKCCVTDRCTLCCVTAEIDPIYQHLVGAKHRTKYIKNILGQQVIKLKVINLSKITVNRVSNKIEGCGHFTMMTPNSVMKLQVPKKTVF